jgi:hypothetical protein
MPSLNRRAFLALAALLAPVARLRAVGPGTLALASEPAAISVDEFLRLSQRLVGRTRLDTQVAATYFNALLAAPGNVALLAQLAQGPGARAIQASGTASAAHLALERTIIEWWYTGTYTLGGERRLATHTGALMWSALGMPAPGTCASGFGAWSRPSTRAARSGD